MSRPPTSLKRLTPLQAIRAHCVRCMGDAPKLVAQCCAPKCHLFHMRKAAIAADGEAPRRGGRETNPVAAIRANCLECVGWLPVEVEICSAGTCPLIPYRMGVNEIKSEANRKSTLRRMEEGWQPPPLPPKKPVSGDKNAPEGAV